MKVAIIGASSKRNRYSNKAVRAYVNAGYEVLPVHPKELQVEELAVISQVDQLPQQLDRILMYLSADKSLKIISDLSKLNPKEIWFNPGTYDADVLARVDELGMKKVVACAILDLGVTPGDFPD